MQTVDNDIENMNRNPQIEKPKRENTTATQELYNRINQIQKELKNNTVPMTFHVWDFAGQEIYYNTHHFFLSNIAIYLLIVDISLKDKSHQLERVKFWLKSIRFYASDAPILIIATHCDLLTTIQIESRMKTIWKLALDCISNPPDNTHCIPISCRSTINQNETRQLLLSLAEQQIYSANRHCSFMWVLFYDTLLQTTSSNTPTSQQHKLTFVLMEQIKTVASACGLEEDDIKEALQFFHDLGFLLYFSQSSQLQDVVFLNPQELVNAIRIIITASKPPTEQKFGPGATKAVGISSNKIHQFESGRIKPDDFAYLWRDYPKEIHPQLRALLIQFELALPDPNQSNIPTEQRDFIVPCLVQEEQPPELHFTNSISCRYQLNDVPSLGFSNWLIIRALQLSKPTTESRPYCYLFKSGCAITLHSLTVKIDVSSVDPTIQVKDGHKDKLNCEKVIRDILKEIQNAGERYKVKTKPQVISKCIGCQTEKELPSNDISFTHFLCDRCLGKKY